MEVDAGMNEFKSMIFALTIIVFLSMTITIVSAQGVGPEISTTQSFSPGDSVGDEIIWGGDIGLFGLIGAHVAVDIGVFCGVTLPFEVTVSCPEWVVQGNSFTTTFSAQGKSGGRAGLDFSAGLDITLYALGNILTWPLVDETLSLDLSADFTTPIGSEVSSPMTNEIWIAGVEVPLIGVEVGAYLGVVAQANLEGVLSSSISATGSSLTSQLSDSLSWDYQGETHSRTHGTRSSGSSPVSISLSDITLSMNDLIIRATSVYIEFRATGFDPIRLELPLPDLFSASTGADAEYGGYSVGPLSVPVRSSSENGPSGPDPPIDTVGLVSIAIVGVVVVAVVIGLARRN